MERDGPEPGRVAFDLKWEGAGLDLNWGGGGKVGSRVRPETGEGREQVQTRTGGRGVGSDQNWGRGGQGQTPTRGVGSDQNQGERGEAGSDLNLGVVEVGADPKGGRGRTGSDLKLGGEGGQGRTRIRGGGADPKWGRGGRGWTPTAEPGLDPKRGGAESDLKQGGSGVGPKLGWELESGVRPELGGREGRVRPKVGGRGGTGSDLK